MTLDIQTEAARRRTFAIISHPDAGKTTLTEKLLLFGVQPAEIELPLDFPNYQIQRYNNQVYLTAPLLSNFKDNKAEKTKLWNCLKQIFAI